jgi:Zn-dependent membrane protease YugP
MYLVFILPAMALSMWASFRTKSAFNKYSQVRSSTGYSGAEAARMMLDREGLHSVKIERANGFLSDHYNPLTRSLALSEGVYDSRSIAAIGVATHEAGHAVQHARNYAPLWLRSMLVPTASIGSNIGYFVMLIGLMLQASNMVLVGAVLFSMVLLFQVVTLPVEFDASARAKTLAVQYGIVSSSERQGMDRVLNAAALTYVAAAFTTLLTLLYFLMRAGLLGGRRDE